jgi:uncharacterized repeat protein (TIGR04138 family)
MDIPTEQRFAELLHSDPRYHREAYGFIFEALDYTVREVVGGARDDSGNQHVTGQELLEGIRQFALNTFGCLAATVLRGWGVRRSEDFGEIVFNLVDHGLMGKQDTDLKEHFSGGYGGHTFQQVFDVEPVFDYDSDRDEWEATYEGVIYKS